MGGRARSLLALLLLALQGAGAFRSPLSGFKRFKETTRSFSNECLGTTRPVIPIDASDFALDIRMPGVTPKQLPFMQWRCAGCLPSKQLVSSLLLL